jgi:hypothetical protein
MEDATGMNQISKLKEFVERRKPKLISFWSENQAQYDVTNPCSLRLSFESMLIFENPNVICLKDERSSLCFNRIKDISYSDELLPIGVIVNVICGSDKNTHGDVTYSIFVS